MEMVTAEEKNCIEFQERFVELGILLTLILECEDSDELMGDPTSNFCCEGEDNFEFSMSITLSTADEETFLRNFVPPLLSH